MATSGRPSSSHRSERLPPHASARNGVAANISVNSQQQQQQQQSQNSRGKIVSANSRRSVTPTSRTRSPRHENDPGSFLFLIINEYNGLHFRLRN